MKPTTLQTKIFLDSGDASETKRALGVLGFLDGQTTNPSLIVQNPRIQNSIHIGEQFSLVQALGVYKEIVQEIAGYIPNGSISIEVPVEVTDTSHQLIELGRVMSTWIPNAHIKYPIIPKAMEAANIVSAEGMRVNMTLCFTQAQAAAVHMATIGAQKGDVFVSPFLGRLHDTHVNDVELIRHCQNMYQKNRSHVEILAASIRDLEHFMMMLSLKVDIITAPLHVLEEWANQGMPVPDAPLEHEINDFETIPFESIDLNGTWTDVSIEHPLTESGMMRFEQDWHQIVKKNGG